MQDKKIAIPKRQDASEQATRSSLPSSLTPLIGRERELREICTLFLRPQVRLLTLTGTGGVGKTRLGLEVAHVMMDEFADGVCFVALAPVSDPELVIPAIAQTLELRQTGDRPILEQLQALLQPRQMLLLLDNFEQILAAAPQLAGLLAFCPKLHLLITSRAILRLPSEYEFPVPALAIPNLAQRPDDETIAQAAAVQLFVQRAQAVQPAFRLTPANTSIIAEICTRLDGLPLALELAAARIKLLPPQNLLERLERPLSVLTRGASGLHARQQTIRATIQWSYELLDGWEQRLFRLCSVFVGGFTLQAVEALCTTLYDGNSEEMGSVLDGVDSLVNKSLLQPPRQEDEGDEPHLSMLETVREYGRECLLANGEMEAARRAHGQYFLGQAEEAEPHLNTPEEASWIRRLERNLDNLRAAMAWSLEYGGQVYDMEFALRLGTASGFFWLASGRLHEGVAFLEQAITGCEGVAASIQARALSMASTLVGFRNDLERSESLLERSLALYRELGDSVNIAYQLRKLGWRAHVRYNFEQAQIRYEESLALYQACNDEQGIHGVLYNMAYLAQNRGDYERARVLFETVLAFQRRRGHRSAVASTLGQLAQLLYLSHAAPPFNEIQSLLDEGLALVEETGDRNSAVGLKGMMAWIAFGQGDLVKARLLIEGVLQYCKQIGRELSVGFEMTLLARINAAEGRYAEARARFEDGMNLGRKQNDMETISSCLIGLGVVAVAQKNYAWAVRLWGADEQLREAAKIFIYPVDRAEYDGEVAAARIFLGEQAFSSLWAEGRPMSLEEVLSERASLPLKQPPQSAQPLAMEKALTYPAGLSAREVEVLRLVAQGWSDAEVAEHLVISMRTVNTHLTSIYRKIQVTSRSSATRYAVEHQLT